MNKAISIGVIAATILVAGCDKKSPSSPTTPPAAQADAASAYPGDWIWEPNSQALDRVPRFFLLRPSTLPANNVPFDMMGKNRYLARGKTLKELITVVWSQKNSALKIKFDADLPEGKFDFIAADQPHWWNKLQSEIDERFHLVEPVDTSKRGEEVVVRNSDKP